MTGLLIAVIYLCFISLGLPDPLIGSAWPVMQAELGVPLSFMGLVTMLISCCTIISSLFADRLTRRLGTFSVTLYSILLTAVGLMGFSLSDRFWMLCLFALPYGLGAGAIDAALNNYVALHFSSRYMSWLHCFWGVGTIISPYIMSYCLSARFGWNAGYRTVAVLQLAIALILLLSLPLWRRKGAGAREEVPPANLTLREKLRIRGVPLILLSFFCYAAVEATVGAWVSSYLVITRGMPKERAAAFGSLFYIGMTAGRFLFGFITDRLGDRRLIRLGSCMILSGVLLLFLPVGSGSLTLPAFIIIGVGCAPIYPSIVHATPTNFGRENSQAIIGLQMASANLGFTLMPPLYGLIANYIDAALLPVFLVVFLALHVLFAELLNRCVRKNPIGEVPQNRA